MGLSPPDGRVSECAYIWLFIAWSLSDASVPLYGNTGTYIGFSLEYIKRLKSFVAAFVPWGILDGLHQDDATSQHVGGGFKSQE